MKTLKLAPHQEKGKAFIKYQPTTKFMKFNGTIVETNEGKALFFSMGTGKTTTVLDALYDMNPTENVLIIAPKDPALTTWYDEVEKWNYPFRIKSFLVDEKGKEWTKKKRDELLATIISKPTKPTVYIINREKLKWLINSLPKSKGVPIFPFPYVVIDESHKFKNPTSVTFRQFIRVRPQVKWITLLTGTPTPRSLLDLWSQIYLLDQGKRLGTNYYSFRDRYFYPIASKDDHPVAFTPRPWAKEAIFRQIKDVIISTKNMNLPPLIKTIDYVHMNEIETKYYNEFKRELVLLINEDTEVIAQTAAVLQIKLSQYASGCLYVNNNRGSVIKPEDYIVCHTRKIDYTKYLVENINTPVLISYYYKTDAIQLKKAFPNAVIYNADKKIVDDWNNDKIPILLLHSRKAAGLNLQYSSCQHLIWYSLSFDLEAYEQVNTRLHRKGQKRTIYIHHVLTKNTIDRYILERLEDKSTTQNDLIESVKLELKQ